MEEGREGGHFSLRTLWKGDNGDRIGSKGRDCGGNGDFCLVLGEPGRGREDAETGRAWSSGILRSSMEETKSSGLGRWQTACKGRDRVTCISEGQSIDVVCADGRIPELPDTALGRVTINPLISLHFFPTFHTVDLLGLFPGVLECC